MTRPNGYKDQYPVDLTEYEPGLDPGYSNGNGNGHKRAGKARANGHSQEEQPSGKDIARIEYEQERNRFTDKPALDIFDFAELAQERFEPMQWIIPDILPEGVTFFFSAPKLGKSITALALSLRMARRTSGGIDGSVLYLSLDDTSKRRLQGRVLDLLQGEKLDNGRVYGALTAESLDKGLIEQLTTWLDTHTDTKLIVVDVYANIKPTRKSDVYKGDIDAVHMLQRLGANRHVAILVLHHNNKRADTEDWLNSLNGSQGIGAGCDTIWKLVRIRGESDMTLKISGRDTGDLTVSLNLDDLNEPWQPVEPEERKGIKELESKIISTLQEAGKALYPREVARLIDVKSVRMAMQRMLKKKLLSQVVPYGPYMLQLQLSSKPALQATSDDNCNKNDEMGKLLQLSSKPALQATSGDNCNCNTHTSQEEPVTLVTLEPVIDSFSTVEEIARASQEARAIKVTARKPPERCEHCGFTGVGWCRDNGHWYICLSCQWRNF